MEPNCDDIEGRMDKPKFFLNKNNGDMLITWFTQNIPKEDFWVEISELCYNVITDN